MTSATDMEKMKKVIVRPTEEAIAHQDFKPSPFRYIKFDKEMTRYLCVEISKTKAEAGPEDNMAAFVTTNQQLRAQGSGFCRDRLDSGQVVGFYFVEMKLDGFQLYGIRDAKTVSTN